MNSIRLAFVALGLWLVLPTIGYARSPLTDAEDIKVRSGSVDALGTENSIYIHPLNDSIIVIAHNGPAGGSGWVTDDRGDTWYGSNGGYGEGDPVVVIRRPLGAEPARHFMCGLNAEGFDAWYKDVPSGTTWTASKVDPVTEVGDKPYVWVDNNPASLGKGNLYAAWTYGARIKMFVNTTNADDAWTFLQSIDAGTSKEEWGVDIKVGISASPDYLGHVYAAWGTTVGDPQSRISGINFRRSENEGANWGPIETIALPGTEGLDTSGDLNGKNMSPNSAPSMTVDDSGNIYVVWAQKNLGNSSDVQIYLKKSTDEGDNWPATPLLVNQDSDPEGVIDQWYPWMTWDSCTDAIAVVYLDSRHSVYGADTYVSVSYDGAASFSPSDEVRVSDESWDGDQVVQKGYDYIGIVASDGIAYPVWSDDREADDGETFKVYMSPVYLWGVEQDSVFVSHVTNGDSMTLTATWTTNIAADSSDVLTLFSPNDSVYTSVPVADAGTSHQAVLTVPCEPGYWHYTVSSARCNCIQPRTSDLDSFFVEPQVTLTASWPDAAIGGAACPAGDFDSLIVTVEYEGSCVATIDAGRMALDSLAVNIPNLAFFPEHTQQVGTVSANSGNSFTGAIVEHQVGGCGSDSVVVFLDGVSIGKVLVPSRPNLDLNGTGNVDSGDIAVFSGAYTSCPSDSNYNACANFVDPDTATTGCVNWNDYLNLAGHLGHEYGTPLFKSGLGGPKSTKLYVEPGTPSGTVDVSIRVGSLSKSAAYGVVLRPPAGKLQSVTWLPESEYAGTTAAVETIDAGGRRLSVAALVVHPDASGETQLGILRFTDVGTSFSLADLPVSYEDITEYETSIQSARSDSPKPVVPQFKNQLHANRPNPFNPHTTISFSLAVETHAQLAIYDVSGRLVRNLVSTVKSKGDHSVVWDGRDDSGRSVASGIYIYRLLANQFSDAGKMVVLR